MRLLVLSGGTIDGYFKNAADDFVVFSEVYKKGIINRVLRNVAQIIGLSLVSDCKREKIKNYDCVIVFDAFYKRGIVNYLRKANHNIRIIIYYWNRIEDHVRNINFKDIHRLEDIEIWSYNYDDSIKYGVGYNHQFWNTRILTEENKTEYPLYDACFIGSEKGRVEIIRELHKWLESNGFKGAFYIADNKTEKYNMLEYGKRIPYDKYVNEIAYNSRVIIDLVTDEYRGITLRPLEALFMGKKLITNNSDIKNEKFYDENNVFILGQDSIQELGDFIKGEYRLKKGLDMSEYNICSWIKRFGM